MLEHIHFSRLSAGRVLAVLVTQAGAVLDRVLVLDRELTHLELETAARYLNETFHGWPIERIRTEVARRMDEERAAYHQLLASVEELCRKGALAVGEGGSVLFVEGMANLIAAEVDRERLKQMLLALEAKQRLVDLLTAYVDGRQQEVRVVVGLDEASPAMQDLVLIGAPARLGGTSLGTVAVIAPTRIQYQEMIQAVRYVARLSERILEIPDSVRGSRTSRVWRGCKSARQWDFAPRRRLQQIRRRLPRNLSLNKKRNIWGIRRDMPEKEAELTALENAESAAAENASAEAGVTRRAGGQATTPRSAGQSSTSFRPSMSS